jgi:predicted nucleic acid-binding protein
MLSANAAAAALKQLQNDLANDFIVLDLSHQLFASAVALVYTYELRAYDAVQLAGAVELNRVRASAGLSLLTIVSADLELNAAAQAERLAVEDPNHHP